MEKPDRHRRGKCREKHVRRRNYREKEFVKEEHRCESNSARHVEDGESLLCLMSVVLYLLACSRECTSVSTLYFSYHNME